MKCPECKSEHIRKNGMRRGKQNHICVNCGRQFVENPQNHRGYSDEVRKICLKMYLNGMGFRGIEICYSKSLKMLKHSIRLLIPYLKFEDVPISSRFLP